MRYKSLTISTNPSIFEFDGFREISVHQLSQKVGDSDFFETDRAYKEIFQISRFLLDEHVLSSPGTPWGSPAGIDINQVDRNKLLHTPGLFAIRLDKIFVIPRRSILVYDEGLIIKEYLGEVYHRHAMNWVRKKFSYRNLSFQVTKRISKVCHSESCGIDFSTDIGDKNVFHWIARVLPKVRFLQQMPSDWPLVFSYEPNQFQLESLKVLGVTNPILVIDHDGPTFFEKYVLIDGAWASINKLMMSYLRESFLPVAISFDVKRYKKLFIFREDSWTRKLLNRPQIKDYLSSRGFACLSLQGVGLVESISLFQAADEIVFEHGAAGVFLMFAKESAKVIEIIPSKVHVTAQEPTNFFYWLCKMLDISFDYVICENIRNDPWAEFELDLEILKKIMTALSFES